MKRSTIKMLLFQAVILLVLIINSFYSNILSGFKMPIFLLAIFIAFKFIFGIEKDRHRYTKDILFDTVIILLVYFLLFYLLGIFIGFAKTENYYTLLGFKNFIIPLILFIILKEMLRYEMLVKIRDDKLLIVTTCILFIFLDISDAIYYNSFTTPYTTFIFIALNLLPAISTSIVCTYVTRKVGYRPLILFLLATELYLYLLPIVPDPSEYLMSVIRFLLPIILGYRVFKFFKKVSDEQPERTVKKVNWPVIVLSSAIIMFLVYITSGYFTYYAIAVASGSMEPTINKGDVVIVEKIKGKFEMLNVGDTVAFKYSNVVIVHRIIKIVKKNDQYYFYTKGDANDNADGYAVEEDMMIGIVRYKVPYIGAPTVWLNE